MDSTRDCVDTETFPDAIDGFVKRDHGVSIEGKRELQGAVVGEIRNRHAYQSQTFALDARKLAQQEPLRPAEDRFGVGGGRAMSPSGSSEKNRRIAAAE